jgi:hypothetical protein
MIYIIFWGLHATATKGTKQTMEKLPVVKIEDGVRYILAGDRYLPDIVKPTGESVAWYFQHMRALFLLNHRRDIFLQLQENGELMEHLRKIEVEAQDMRKNLMEQMLKADPIPESLKDCKNTIMSCY